MSFFSKLFSKKNVPNNSQDKTQNNPRDYVPDNTRQTAQEFTRIMTSQLVALWLDSNNDAYRDEYIRRIKMCGLSNVKATKMLEFESKILKKHPRPEMLSKDFLVTPMFSLLKPYLDHPIDYYQDHLEYPLSYVIKLSDEAEWHYWNSHEKSCLSDEAWEEIFALSDRNKKLFLPLGMHLVEKMHWSYDNVNKFSYNEQGMLDLYRWNKRTSASSTPWK